MLPVPDEAIGRGTFPARARRTKSAASVAGFVAAVTNTSTLLTTSDTGAKSRCMS